MREIEHARTFWPAFLKQPEAAWPMGTVSRVLQPHPRLIEYPEGTWRNQDAQLVRDIPPVHVSTLIFDLVILHCPPYPVPATSLLIGLLHDLLFGSSLFADMARCHTGLERHSVIFFWTVACKSGTHFVSGCM